jgi:membrane protein YqaA with SNARE-associated domain
MSGDAATRKRDRGHGPDRRPDRDPPPGVSGRRPVELAEGAPDPERVGPAVWIAGGAMLALGVLMSVLMLGHFRSRSYLYLFLYSIPSNAAISIFPHEPVLLYFGKFADPWIAAAAATAGTLVAGWMDHTVFVPVLHLRALQGYRESRLYRRSIELYRRWPFLTLVLAGFTPLPFFPFKFLSFSTAYPMPRYLAALAVARFPRYLLLLWVGEVLELPTWVLVALFLASLVVYAWRVGPTLWLRLRRRVDPRRVPCRDGPRREPTTMEET